MSNLVGIATTLAEYRDYIPQCTRLDTVTERMCDGQMIIKPAMDVNHKLAVYHIAPEAEVCTK